jgi:ABC-type polysaccharide/polyol phosphate transport system ATPase subunit
MALIELKDVWEMYRIKFIRDGKSSVENFWALRDIHLDIEKGEILGIVGENGSGKSTLLKLIAGMLRSDRGEVNIRGKVSGLLELGAGFQHELTGFDNIYLIASLFGLSKEEAAVKVPRIVDFAGLGKFIHAPVKCYSQGMFVRLAFAIAIHMDPDIFLIDDTLAVGDEYFQRQCIKKIFELKEEGKTIVFVTHDISMLKRLCPRALLLKEGRIVKDGPVDDVLPLYTQLVGDRQGVGLLQRGPVKAIFNNGKLLINWQDRLITLGTGVTTSFLADDRWYHSLQAQWQVVLEGEGRLRATGTFYGCDALQIWSIRFVEEGIFQLDIEMESQQPLFIQQGCTTMMLSHDYGRWFANVESGVFADIQSEDKKWQALFEKRLFSPCIGVGEAKTPSGKIPSVMLECCDNAKPVFAQIANSDFLSNSRVLQYRTEGSQNDMTACSAPFFYFSGKIRLDTPELDVFLKTREDGFSLTEGPLRLVFDNGRLVVFYQDLPLTKGQHLTSSVCANGKRYVSDAAIWNVTKKGRGLLRARGLYARSLFAQVWEIEMTGPNSFLWKVALEPRETMNVDQQCLHVMAPQDYGSWFSEYGQGDFPKHFLEMCMDMAQRCIPDGAIGLKSEDPRFPAIRLGFSKELENFAKIINSDFYNKARILQIEKVEPENSREYLQGEVVPCFAVKVVLDKDDPSSLGDAGNRLEEKNIRIVFDKGAGRLYEGGCELTKKLGIYTSVRSQGRWHDSSSAGLWKIEENRKGFMRLRGKWLYLPIFQNWEMRLKEDGSLEWTVAIEACQELEVDRLQANIMLSERYSHWVMGGEEGIFPPFKENVDDDWDRIRSGDVGVRAIGVLQAGSQAGGGIPGSSVILTCEEFQPDHSLNIVNSDVYHRGRVLQYAHSHKKLLLPGTYPYFKGKITMGC